MNYRSNLPYHIANCSSNMKGSAKKQKTTLERIKVMNISFIADILAAFPENSVLTETEFFALVRAVRPDQMGTSRPRNLMERLRKEGQVS